MSSRYAASKPGNVQRNYLKILGQTQSPNAVISRSERAVSELHAADDDPDRPVERNRVSKSIETYTQYTQNVATLEHARDQDLVVYSG
jgi:DNA polymerase I